MLVEDEENNYTPLSRASNFNLNNEMQYVEDLVLKENQKNQRASIKINNPEENLLLDVNNYNSNVVNLHSELEIKNDITPENKPDATYLKEEEDYDNMGFEAFTKEEELEIENALNKGAIEFFEKHLEEIADEGGLAKDEIKVMIFKEDNLLDVVQEGEGAGKENQNQIENGENSNLKQNNKKEDSADSADSMDLKENKIKQVVLLMDDDVFSEFEQNEGGTLMENLDQNNNEINHNELALHVEDAGKKNSTESSVDSSKSSNSSAQNKKNALISDADKLKELSNGLTPLEDVTNTAFKKLNEKRDSLKNTKEDNTKRVFINRNKNRRESVSKMTKLTKKKEERVQLKDKKIIVNLEEIEKQYMNSDKLILEGELDPGNHQQLEKVSNDLVRMHPHQVKEGKVTPYKYCEGTGWFCCGDSCSRSEMERLGIGILCYFKVLKVFIICFLIISLLNAPLLWVYFTNQQNQSSVGYREYLFRSTIGNIASSTYNCLKIPVGNIFNTNNPSHNFAFDCVDRNITSVTKFGATSKSNLEVENLSNCANFTTFSNLWVDTTCDMTSYIQEETTKKCLGKLNCNFDLQLDYIRKNCKYSLNATYYLYLKYECHNSFISLGYNDLKIERGLFGFFVVGTDIASIIVLLICMLIITLSQKSNEQQFKERNIFISDYTLHLKDLEFPVKNLYLELDKIVKHFNTVLQIEEKIKPQTKNIKKMVDNLNFDTQYTDASKIVNTGTIEKTAIFDINYPMFTTDKFEDILKYNKCVIDRRKIEKTIGNSNDNSEKLPNISKNLEDEKRLKEIKQKMKKIKNSIKSRDELEMVKELYITFRNQKIADFYYSSYKKGRCVRCCYICCCKYEKIKHF